MHIRRISLIILAISMLGMATQAEELDIGDPMPEKETEMKNIDGKMLTLKEIAGEKGTLVIFTCRHCPFAQALQERMVKIGNEYKKKDVGVVFVNSNDPEKYSRDGFESMREQARKNNYKFPYVMDTTSGVAKAFGALRTPEAFLFDSEKKLVYHGAIDDNARNPEKVEKQYLRNALEALLSGEEIPKQKTGSIGCGIKFRK